MSKLVLVGELNPYGSDPQFALYHLPRHASGNRLREILGLNDSAYEAIDKINLCTRRWSMKTARAEAWMMMLKYDRLVLLGAKVRDAFEGPEFFQMDIDAPEGHSVQLLTLPHPSGLNRSWNEPGARERARGVMRVFAPELYLNRTL